MEQNVHRIVVPDTFDGGRLDQVLARLLPDQSRSALGRLVDQGAVAISGRTAVRRSERVHAGDEIAVAIPTPAPPALVPRDLPLPILHQDRDIAVVDKPPGLVVHPAAGHADGTLVHALLFHLGDLSGVGGELRPGIVHRLDKETSGVLVIAKHDAAHRALTAVWNTPAVEKEYLALVYGAPKAERGTIDRPIGRDPRDRKRMAIVVGGRRAVTDYTIAESFPYLSLLRCSLRTGRTHQIRVHLKAIGHPIVGDPLYSGPQWKGIPNKKLQRALAAFPRQALHAARLAFPHPSTGERVAFEAPLPQDFADLLRELRS